MSGSLLIESHYLPSLEYVCAIQGFDKIILENDEHFVKQSLRNRCYINAAHGIQMLVVPLTGKHGKVPFRDVKIETGTKWRNNQWRTISSAYAGSPFFEHYGDHFHRAIFTNYQFLHELNRDLLSLCLRDLGLAPAISETVAYEKLPDTDVSDLRSVISLKEGYSDRTFYQPQPYYQVFGNAFADNLSIIDLLFCDGPNAGNILKASKKKI